MPIIENEQEKHNIIYCGTFTLINTSTLNLEWRQWPNKV